MTAKHSSLGLRLGGARRREVVVRRRAPPVVVGLELSKPRYEGWRLSHAVIHTRVYGQAAAVGSLVLVFGFKDILRQSGAPFKVE